MTITNALMPAHEKLCETTTRAKLHNKARVDKLIKHAGAAEGVEDEKGGKRSPLYRRPPSRAAGADQR